MNTLRIFISSPSDVREERTVAGRVIERLQGKYWSFVRLDDVFWENRVARATAHFQDELLNPGQCDMVVGILWTRLGSALPEKFRTLTGEAHATGTEWELAQAFAAYDESLARTGDPLVAKPDVVVYRRTTARDSEDADARGQREAVEGFIEREFFNQDAHHTIKRAITFYATPDEFEARLQSDLEQLILRRIPALKPGFEPPPISGPPFKDLAVFEFEDSDRFFGRNRAIRELQQRLAARAENGMPFVLIYGGSGYGKSSLMRAGLAPVLTRPGGALAGMDRWRRVLLQPGKGTGPLCERLARVLLAAPSADDLAQQKTHAHWPLPGLPELAETSIEPDDSGEKWDAASLARLLADDTKLVFAAAGVARTLDRIGHSLLLQIDQLEEVFTGETISAAEREAFFRAIAALTRTGRVWTVATMRSEYFPRIAETPALAALVRDNGGYILAPPGEQELREIIRFPALAARLDFERATSPREIAGTLCTAEHLDDQILADAKGSADALPLLEFTLHKLHAALTAADGRRTGDLLRWDTYAALGGLKGAIARTAEDTFKTLAPHVQGAADALFGNLVRVDAGASDLVTRKRPRLAELRTAAPGAGDFLDAFLAARLLVTDEESGTAIITLAHEALITHWPRLAEWVARHRAILRSRQRLEENTRQWADAGRAKKLLLAEGRLAEAEEVERSPLFRLAEDERALVATSRTRARKRMRFFQAAAALFALLAIGASIAGVIAWQQKQIATTNETKALANEQRALAGLREASRSDTATAQQRLAEGKWQEAVAYLGRAIRYDEENRNAQNALWLALRYGETNGLRDPFAALSTNPKEAMAGDATALLTKGSRAVVHPLVHSSPVSIAFFPPGDDHAVTVTAREIRLWHIPDGSFRTLVSTMADQITRTSSSASGTHVSYALDDRSVHSLETNSGHAAGPAISHEKNVRILHLSDDGSVLLTVDEGNAVRLWDSSAARLITPPISNEAQISNASLSPDASKFLSADDAGDVRVRWVRTGLDVFPPIKHSMPCHAAFSKDGKRIVSASLSHDVHVWDAANGARIGVPIEHHSLAVGYPAVADPDASTILAVSKNNEMQLWSVADGKPVGVTFLNAPKNVKKIEFSPDGNFIVTANSDSSIQLWDGRTGLPVGPLLKHEASISSAVFAADSARLISASTDHTAHIWSVKNGTSLTSDFAESLTAAVSGKRLDPTSGQLISLDAEIRDSHWRECLREASLAPGWRFAILPHLPVSGVRLSRMMSMNRLPAQTQEIDQNSSLTVRAIATQLLEKIHVPSVRKAATIDPAHPVMGVAIVFERFTEPHSTFKNAMIVDTLLQESLERMPGDTSPENLRLAARYIAEVATRAPERVSTAKQLSVFVESEEKLAGFNPNAAIEGLNSVAAG